MPRTHEFIRPSMASAIPVICDLDSTLADTSTRADFSPNHTKGNTWDDYAMHCAGDLPMHGSIRAVRALALHYQIHIVTGRAERARTLTEKWLAEQSVPYDALAMQPDGSTQDNAEFKIEYIKGLIERNRRPYLVLEDWPRVAKAIEVATGVPALVVNPCYENLSTRHFQEFPTPGQLEELSVWAPCLHSTSQADIDKWLEDCGVGSDQSAADVLREINLLGGTPQIVSGAARWGVRTEGFLTSPVKAAALKQLRLWVQGDDLLMALVKTLSVWREERDRALEQDKTSEQGGAQTGG